MTPRGREPSAGTRSWSPGAPPSTFTAKAETRSRVGIIIIDSIPSPYAELLGLEKTQKPFTELRLAKPQDRNTGEPLLRFGGFPEPVLTARPRDHRRWPKDHIDRFFREDVRDLGAVRELSLIEILADLLRDRVGSLLSINSLREDIEVSHKAVVHWLDLLDRLYFTFRLSPLFRPKYARSRKTRSSTYGTIRRFPTGARASRT